MTGGAMYDAIGRAIATSAGPGPRVASVISTVLGDAWCAATPPPPK